MATTYDLLQLPTSQPLQLQVGDKLSYSGFVHGSVGFFIQIHIGQPELLRELGYELIYENPNAAQSGMTGADAATAFYSFEATAAGQTELWIHHCFRHETEQSKCWNILINNPL